MFGGTQDNGSAGGPSATDERFGITNKDWYKTLGADGHQSATDPVYNDIIYATTQEGRFHRVDLVTGEQVFIQPQALDGGRVRIGPREHKHGEIKLRSKNVSSGFHVVIAVDIEKYLYGLAEMPSHWNVKALEAQALVGKRYLSWAMDRMDVFGWKKLPGQLIQHPM